MSPVEIILAVACALLLALTTALAVSVWRLGAELQTCRLTVDGLREQVEELVRRERARETAEAAPDGEPEYVITFDAQDPVPVSTQRVVSTTLGEPLIKVAALSHGVRRALREEKRAHLAYQVRREYRRRRRQTRARVRAAR
ncbi:MAG: hypothetical protein ACRDOJ_00360 [Nocardioidaceae bacterium]